MMRKFMINMLAKLGSPLIGSILLVFSEPLFAQDSSALDVRYWKVLNEGKDVRRLEPLLEEWMWPATTNRSRQEILEDVSRLLSKIEALEPLPPVVNENASGQAPRHASDWPSMGGGATHAGVSADPGPTAGLEAWRYPVGWDWQSAPLIKGKLVYVTSPGLANVLFCLDRTTGEQRWAATNPTSGSTRQRRAAFDPIPLTKNEIAVRRLNSGGGVSGYIVLNRQNGRVLREIPAQPQEKKFGPPGQPVDLVASQIIQDGTVLVQSLKTGATWWRFPAGDLSDGPVIVGEHVYAAGEDGTLWAFNLLGHQRVAWTFRIDSPWGAAPTLVDGVLIAGANNGTVYAIDAATGRQKWSVKVTEADPRSRQFFSPVAATEKRLYIGGCDGSLYALDMGSGAVVWKVDCGDWVRSQPFINGSTVCIATLEGKVFAYQDEGSSARLLWEAFPDGHPILSDLDGDAQGVLVNTANLDLVALDLRDGHEQWRRSLIPCDRENGTKIYADSMPELMQAPVTVAEGTVYFAGTDGFVYAVQADTGRRLWRFELGGRISGAPTVCNERVFIGQFGGDGLFYAIDARSGAPLWSRQLGGIWTSAECDNRQLFVANVDGMFYCLDPVDGSVEWTRKFSDGVYSAPALNNELVFTGSWDGHYYALDRSNGDVVWAYSRPGFPYHIGGRPDSAALILAGDVVIGQVLGGRLVALDALTGAERWDWPGIPWRICNVTAAADGETVFVSVLGNAYDRPFGVALYGLDQRTGQELWKLSGLGGLTSPIVTAGSRFVIGSVGSPHICGYQLGRSLSDTPTLLWRYKTGGVMYESLPAVSGNLAFFLSNDGWLRAIR
jgi:outer membrane protein assembly factor BamB